MLPLGEKALSFFFNIVMGGGGHRGITRNDCFGNKYRSGLEINLRLFPFGVELFICRCVGVVRVPNIFRLDCSFS